MLTRGTIASVAEILARKHTYTQPPDFGSGVPDSGGGVFMWPLLLFVGGLFLVIADRVPELRVEAAPPGRIRHDGDATAPDLQRGGPVRPARLPVRAVPEGRRTWRRERIARRVAGGRRRRVRLLVLRRVDRLEGRHQPLVPPVRLRAPADAGRLPPPHDRPGERVLAAGRCPELPRHPVRVRGVQPRLHRPLRGAEVRERPDRRPDDAVAAGQRVRTRLRGAGQSASSSPDPRSTRRRSPSCWASRARSCSTCRRSCRRCIRGRLDPSKEGVPCRSG